MQDIGKMETTAQPIQKNSPTNNQAFSPHQTNEVEQARDQVSKSQQQNIQPPFQKINVQQKTVENIGEESQLGNQVNDFEQFEDHQDQSQALEIHQDYSQPLQFEDSSEEHKQEDNKQVDDKQEEHRYQALKTQQKNILDISKNNQAEHHQQPKDNLQPQKQPRPIPQNLHEKNNPHKDQTKACQQQNNAKSSKLQTINTLQNHLHNTKQSQIKEVPTQKPNIYALTGSVILRQAQKQRIGSIFQHFRCFNRQYEQIIGNYKLIIKNVISQLKHRATYKSNLQNILIEYFQNYSKTHKDFDQQALKMSKKYKEENAVSSNKYLNIKQCLRNGFEQLNSLRKGIATNNQKLDGYINNYVVNSIREAFEEYRNEMVGEEKRQLSQKQELSREEKGFKRMIQSLDRLCKKCIQGVITSEDIFMQLSDYINKEKLFRKILIRYGKTVIQLRKNYVCLETKLFGKLQKILNQFKNQHSVVYVAAKHFISLQDFTSAADRLANYEHLCTITDVDYIKAVLKLQNRKESTLFQNHHFQQYLEIPFIDPFIAEAKTILRGAVKKSFPMKKANCELIHTISQNLIEYEKELNECRQKIVIKNVNANIVGEGSIQFNEMVRKAIFTEHRNITVHLKSADRADELISYLNQMQQLGKN